jgi:hypothetical protein
MSLQTATRTDIHADDDAADAAKDARVQYDSANGSVVGACEDHEPLPDAEESHVSNGGLNVSGAEDAAHTNAVCDSNHARDDDDDGDDDDDDEEDYDVPDQVVPVGRAETRKSVQAAARRQKQAKTKEIAAARKEAAKALRAKQLAELRMRLAGGVVS